MSGSTPHGERDGEASTPAPHEGGACCDLVLKGGITSGVLYPRFVADLSERYRFCNIGGASAGAIAAAGCAAAEHRRRLHGDARGFATLKLLSDDLGRPDAQGVSKMQRLFQPAPALRDHWAVLLGALGDGAATHKARAVLGALVGRWGAWVSAPLLLSGATLVAVVCGTTGLPWDTGLVYAGALWCGWTLVAAATLWLSVGSTRRRLVAAGGWAVGAVLTVGPVAWRSHAGLWPSVLLGALGPAVVLGGYAAAAGLCGARFASTLLRGLGGNFYGFCRGMSEGHEEALSEWLHAHLNGLAGMAEGGGPLTFGDLWGDHPEVDHDPRARRVNLEVMTTAVSQHTCFALPFRPGAEKLYAYDLEEWARLFPPAVMSWLEAHAQDGEALTFAERGAAPRPLRRLPRNRDLPVVVAVRMSLSFPVLLSAVPLYAVDDSVREASTHPRTKRVWFSDGGIASNLPVHFFDALLPEHPTFLVNLKPEHPDHPIVRDARCGEDGRVYLPPAQSVGRPRYWPPPTEGAAGLWGFLVSIGETMQNWRDELQFPLPGYRDRIVQVSLRSGEGGLNLTMPAPQIDALVTAGACAAEQLYARFQPEGGVQGDGWVQHRAVRLKTFLALLEDLLRDPCVLDPAWDDVASAAYGSDAGRAQATRLLRALRALGAEVTTAESALRDAAPRPRPVLRATPRV